MPEAPRAPRGIGVPLVTPVDGDGRVCAASVEALVASVASEAAALMPAMSSGEGWKLSEEQWRSMVTATRRAAGTSPVFAGLMLPTTDEVIARGHLAAELGADGVAVTSPFGEVAQEEILEHYRRVASALPLPVLVYNEGAISGNRTELDTLVEICALPGVVGLKESSGVADLAVELARRCPATAVFQGWENLPPGGAGYVTALANLEPGLCRRMFERPSDETQAEMVRFCEDHGLFEDDWYLAIKRVLADRGVIRRSTAQAVDAADRSPAHAL